MSATASPLAETAGRHMVRGVATAPAGASVGEVVRALRRGHHECLANVHVVDDEHVLRGIVPIARLLAADDDVPVARLMAVDHLGVDRDLDQEHLLTLAARHRQAAPPVVDAAGRLLGCVPPEALIEIGRHEHSQDISRLAGIVHGSTRSRAALEASPWRRAARRLPWLCVGLAGSAVATLVVSLFEQQLSGRIAIAFFIPAIVYLADAVGTQTEAAVTRALSFLAAPRLLHLVGGEIAAGALIGTALGLLTLPLVYLGFGDLPMAVAVALSIAVASMLAALSGLVFPLILDRLGFDPAFGSGPVATVIQDVLSLLVYFLIVGLIVSPA